MWMEHSEENIYRVIRNYCRSFNNLSYTIPFRYQFMCFFYLIEQHSKFLLHSLQVLYMCTLCDSTNIQHDNRVRSKLFVACQRWWFQWRFWFVLSGPGYMREEEEYKPDSWRNPIERNNMGLHLENEVALVKTPTNISNNPVCKLKQSAYWCIILVCILMCDSNQRTDIFRQTRHLFFSYCAAVVELSGCLFSLLLFRRRWKKDEGC